MFSGIIEGVGTILKWEKVKNGARLLVKTPFSLSSTRKGDSIAVNGCCLTVVSKTKNSFAAELSSETLKITSLGRLKPMHGVNLERSLRFSDRLGGHLVQGHVDAVGKVLKVSDHGLSREIRIGFPKKLRRYMIPKGSITVDGISMTIVRLTAKHLTLVVVPHTLKKTNLKSKKAGDLVNLEVDMVGKYLLGRSLIGL